MNYTDIPRRTSAAPCCTNSIKPLHRLPPIVCPCCSGRGVIDPAAPVPLTPTQLAVWNAVRKSPHGITAPEIAVKVYCDRYDGGPLFAKGCIYAAIKGANRRLRAAGLAIASTTHTRGAVYGVVSL